MEQAVLDEDERLSMDDDGRYSDVSDSTDENDSNSAGNRSFDVTDLEDAVDSVAAEAEGAATESEDVDGN